MTPRARPGIALAAALFAPMAVAVVLLRPVLPIDETRYLTVAWDMWLGGSKIVPHLNGALYTHKPPLLFWLIDLAWWLTGRSDLAARLVAPAFGVASVALTGLLARRLWPADPGRAALASLMVATNGVFLAFGTATMFDTMLTVATLSAMLATLAMRRSDGWGPVIGLGAAIALGVYAKGPVILVHVLPVALAMPLWTEPASRPGYGRWLGRVGAAVLVALGLVLLWLGPALVLGGAAYRDDVLWRQSAGRMVAAFAHDRPFWFFLALLPVYLWPWGLTRRGLGALSFARIRGDEASRLVAIWGVAALAAFSLISGKQVHYLIPELPALALLLAGGGLPRGAPRWPYLLLALPVAGALVAAVLVWSGLIEALPANGAVIGTGGLALATVIVVGACLAILLPQRVWPGVALVGPALVLTILVATGPLLWGGYDPRPLGALLKTHEAAGLAVTDAIYHGQFNWAGGLTVAVATLPEPSDRDAWIAAHPGGLLLSREEVGDARLTLAGTRQFHGKTYDIYVVGDAAP